MQVIILKQTNYDGQPLFQGDAANVDEKIANRWIDRKIARDATGQNVIKEPVVKKVESTLSESKPADKIHQTPTDAALAMEKINAELLSKIPEAEVRAIAGLQGIRGNMVITLDALLKKLIKTKGLNEQIKNYLAEVDNDSKSAGS